MEHIIVDVDTVRRLPPKMRIIRADCAVTVLCGDGVTTSGPGPMDIEVTDGDVIYATWTGNSGAIVATC